MCTFFLQFYHIRELCEMRCMQVWYIFKCMVTQLSLDTGSINSQQVLTSHGLMMVSHSHSYGKVLSKTKHV